MKTFKVFIFLFTIALALPHEVWANEVWSSRQRNEHSFVRTSLTPFFSNTSSQSQQVRMCIFDRGNQTCHDFPRNLTPSAQLLFSENTNSWPNFFNRCRQFDARNNFRLSAEIATLIGTGGLGALARMSRVVVPSLIASDVAGSPSQGYPQVNHDYIAEAETIVQYMNSGDRHARVLSMQRLMQLKIVLELCSAHLTSQVMADERRHCLSGCHQGQQAPPSNLTPPPLLNSTPAMSPGFETSDDSLQQLRDYLEASEI